MPINWINYKGRKILHEDFKKLNKEEMIAVVDRAIELVNETDEDLYLLIDFTDTFISEEFFTKVKNMGVYYRDRIKKSAVLGISGIKKVLFTAFNALMGSKGFKAFKDETAAKNFLAE
ncbi:MAG: STAS/SEC14 domain-containing protein [Spirochaetales bacterium]|nr:STAS/SEC14 domain-containing protein [Spirochaetales bacterium]